MTHQIKSTLQGSSTSFISWRSLDIVNNEFELNLIQVGTFFLLNITYVRKN